ncbi:hypothetical protein RclHR1_00600023 [Rhizophagus clarus]|nr:hypothetical protein RclHR1_00600023 [Rhizophagus clarus]
MGEALVKQIKEGIEKDKLCWQWMMYCASDGNSCQCECSGIGKCIEGCPNEILPNNLKNYNDMHLYIYLKKGAQSSLDLAFASHQYPEQDEEANPHQCTHGYQIIHKLQMDDQLP